MKLLQFILAILACQLLAFNCFSQGFLTNGLAAYYPFNGSANDASGNGDNGTLVGSATYDPGINGQGLVLDGNGSGVALANPTNLWLQNFSIETWLQRSSSSVVSYGSGGVATILGDSPGGYYFLMDNQGRLGFAQLGNNNSLTGPAIRDTNWHQVALTLVGGSTVFYVDGVAESTQTYNATFTFTGNVAIGYRPDNADNSFYGTLDEMRVYNRALSAAEVMQLYTYTNNVVDPQITSQPVSVTVNSGDTASFNVGVVGLAALSFQWQKDGVNLANATNATLTLTKVQPLSIGNYTVEVSDIDGAVTSTPASLSISNVYSGAWQGLVAYYPFNGNADDLISSAGNAAVSNAVLTTDRFSDANDAYYFNGTNSWLQTSNFWPVLGTGAVSVSCWIYYQGGVPQFPTESTMLNWGGDLVDTAVRFEFRLIEGNNNTITMCVDGGVVATAVAVIPTNVWTQVAVVKPANGGVADFQFYVNGRSVPLSPVSESQPFNINQGNTLSIGKGQLNESGAQGRVFNGKIDEVRIYNRVLSSNDLAQLFLFESTSIQLIQDVTNTSILNGQTASFSVSASSHLPLSYQWFTSAPNASGPAGAYAQLAGNFVYPVVVTNGGFGYGAAPSVNFVGGGGTGAAGFATVSNGAVIGIAITNAGYGYTSAPSVVIGPPDGYIYGATNSIFTISNADDGDAGNYNVVISCSEGDISSTLAALTVLDPPSITNQPQDEVVAAYAAASLSVAAAGTEPLSYQWVFNGTNFPNAISSVLTVSNVTPANLGMYAVVVANDYGSVTSSIANLYMCPYLEMPFSGAISYWGQTNILSVGAWGSDLSYQWYFDGVAIQGATASMLELAGIQFTNAGLYSVVVSSSYGSVTNIPEQVVVNPANTTLKLFANVMLQGTVGYTYIIQSTSDLSDTNSWITETNLILTQPVEYWDDTSVDVHSSPQKFYRILPGQ